MLVFAWGARSWAWTPGAAGRRSCFLNGGGMHGTTRRGRRQFVGARVRALRRLWGMTVEGLAERSTLPDFLIRAIEDGWTDFPSEHLYCLARALGVGTYDLLGGPEDD